MDIEQSQKIYQLMKDFDRIGFLFKKPKSSYKNVSEVIDNILDSISYLSGQLQSDQDFWLDKLKGQIVQFQTQFQQAEYYLEMEAARACVSDKLDIEDYYPRRYIPIIEKQLVLTYRFLKDFNKSKCIFVGCGPFPISAILLSQKDPMLKIDLLDISDEVSDIAQKVVKKAHLQNRCRVLPACDIRSFADIASYDCIWMAAMIGATILEKIEIYQTIWQYLPTGKILFTRASPVCSIRTFLYPSFPIDRLSHLYRLLRVVDGGLTSIASNFVIQKI